MACNFQTINGVLNVYDDQGNPSQLYKDAVAKFGETTARDIFLASQSDEFKELYPTQGEIDKVSGSIKEYKTRLKINHPLVLGILGMNFKYIIELIRKILGFSNEISFHAARDLMWYNTFLYWQVFKIGFTGAK